MIDLPKTLAARPTHKGLPVPVVNEYQAGDGTVVVDFTAINGLTAIQLAQRRKCGLCGAPFDYWVAFLGGPKAAEQGTYTDPPMHPECAEAALCLCPHIANPKLARAQRHAAEKVTGEEVITPTGWIDDRPDEWIIYITRDYRIKVNPARGEYVFFASPAKELRRFRYGDDGQLQEGTG
jgi:hypothetical protein